MRGLIFVHHSFPQQGEPIAHLNQSPKWQEIREKQEINKERSEAKNKRSLRPQQEEEVQSTVGEIEEIIIEKDLSNK